MKSSFANAVMCVVAILSACLTAGVLACPFCPGPTLTLSEQLADAEAAVLVKWVSGKKATLSEPGLTEFEVAAVMHQPASQKLKQGSKVLVKQFRSAKKGDLFLMMGNVGGGDVVWNQPLETTQACFDYLKDAPKPDQPSATRVAYFVKRLEDPDPAVAADAFGEISNASYADVAALAADLPREKLRKWLTSTSIAPGRLGLYGMMLGLCGNEEDARLMEGKILDHSEEIRIGIDGMMGGYLLLTGEKGLAVLEKNKLTSNPDAFTETYAAIQAIRFMWQHGDERISRERLRQSLRGLLDHPDMADIIVTDLARMKDWSVQEKLMELYESDSKTALKRSIIRFMIASMKDSGVKKEQGGTGNVPAEVPDHVTQAQRYLAQMEKQDPKLVKEVERFLLLK